MKSLIPLLVISVMLTPVASAANSALYLNAFGETATAYLNDSFYLLGTTADGFVADIIQKDLALLIVTNVQKRLRIIRAKLKAVEKTRIAAQDKKLLRRLDDAYACMDQLSWALIQYFQEKGPDTGNRFEEQRQTCLDRIQRVGEYYSSLPPPEYAEPLSTR